MTLNELDDELMEVELASMGCKFRWGIKKEEDQAGDVATDAGEEEVNKEEKSPEEEEESRRLEAETRKGQQLNCLAQHQLNMRLSQPYDQNYIDRQWASTKI